MAKKRTKPKLEVGLTAGRRKEALAAYARCPVHARVAEHLGVDPRTLRRWREEHPDFAAELDAVKAEYVGTTGEMAEAVVHRALRLALDGVPIWHETDTKQGQVVRLESERPYPAHAVRAGLTKHDPSYVVVPKDAEAEDPVAQSLDRIEAAIRGKDEAPSG